MYNVLKYIHNHIKEALNLSDISQQFGYSKWHFCVKFREYTGRSFVKYVRHFRLNLAALEILQGARLLDVAMEYGYESIGGFNKAFLTEFGCYPSDYKKNAKDAFDYYERKKMTMFQLNDRCEILRNIAMHEIEYEERYCMQHRVYNTLGMSRAAKMGLSNTEIIASGMENVLRSFSPVIIPGELIVGFNFPNNKIFSPDIANHGDRFFPKDTERNRYLAKKNGISDGDLNEYFELCSNTPSFLHTVSPELTETEIQSATEWAGIGYCIDSNHSVLDYEKVLKLGFKGIFDEVTEWESKNGTNALYASMKKLCVAACGMGKKYAQEAQRLLDSENSEYSRSDLERIIEVCSRVPEQPATSFMEAVQALWFAHIINTWEDYINANSLGRLDQILYPYYSADIEKGVITKEDAFEIVCCLWIKLYRIYDVQQSCVGGTDINGHNMENELSYMMLDATEQLDFIRCMSVRYSQNTSKEFLKRALEVVGHLQKGVPFFFNDDVMIPALIAKGISPEDAYDYTQIGCVETVIPGKSNPHAVTGKANLLKALEYALQNGKSMMRPDIKPGLETGELESLDTYEKLVNAVKAQIYHLLDLSCSCVRKHRDCSVTNRPKPYKSLLTEGCMESGRDFNDAGAKYDYYQIMLGGIPNLADSLEVLRKFVYEKKQYTLSEVVEILKADYPDESVRLSFINKAAKFGNDIDSVDSIAVDIVNASCDYLDQLSEKYGLSFHAQPFTYIWMIDQGKECAASPDGRRKGEIIAYSVSPMQGRDFNGLTALLNSIAKFPTKRTPGTTSAIVEVDPKLFIDRNIPMLTDILLAASAKGLNNVQFNTIDADMLIDAQKHPEKYNNLAVRVSGFSQKFNLISPELQNHIIARTKHSCL